LADLERPVRAAVEFEIPGHFGGPEREGSLSDSHAWNRLLAFTLDHDRRVALDLGQPFESVHRYVVRLPPAYRLDGRPAQPQVGSQWGTFKLEVRGDQADPRRLEFVLHTRLEKPRIEPADFAEFRKFHEEMSKHWRVWLNLTPTRDVADIAALEAWLPWAPAD